MYVQSSKDNVSEEKLLRHLLFKNIKQLLYKSAVTNIESNSILKNFSSHILSLSWYAILLTFLDHEILYL